jgi:hypothetical protein
MSLPADLPCYRVLTEALRTTTERLAAEVACPTDVAPAWSDVEWDVARAVAVMQGTTVLLAKRLRWRGPESWRNFLRTQTHQALQRDLRIGALLEQVDTTLRDARVGCVALKGSALRRLAIYRPGERPMGDIDLLAQPADAERIARALQAIDYECSFDMRRHRVFAPRVAAASVQPGEHPDNPLKIEVHFRIAEALPSYPVDITAGLRSDDCGSGLRDYAATRELFRHLLLHAAGNMRAHTLRQSQLHDLALLTPRLVPADWQHLLDTPPAGGGAWWMWPVLELARRYYRDSIPPVIDAFRAGTPRWLRHAAVRKTLSDVSWSNLRIFAFPGIQWSRSFGEAMRFVRSRALPERAALNELQVLRHTQPAMLELPWYGISHARRILRWVVSRPPRVQTLNSVLVALTAGRQD